jgi:putative acetyltransferase
LISDRGRPRSPAADASDPLAADAACARRVDILIVMHIRSEAADDIATIRAINLAAFPTSAEADLVERIRASDAFVPTLSLVAELDPGADASSAHSSVASSPHAPVAPSAASQPGHIVGHILLSRVAIAGLDEPILALAPMAVLPEQQRRGIGSALVRAALDVAESLEEPLVVVLGHPWFYPRFGFKRASRYGIFPSEPWPDAAFMAKPMTRWSRDLRGRVAYPPTFDGSEPRPGR